MVALQRAAPALPQGRRRRLPVHVFGFAGDVEWAETLFFSLCHQADAALGFAERGTWESGRYFTTAFLEGFA